MRISRVGKQFLRAILPLLIFLVSGGLAPLFAQASVSVTPGVLQFGNVQIGRKSATQKVTVTNTGTVSLTIQSYSLSLPEFQLTAGVFPIGIAPGTSRFYYLEFVPDAAKTFSGIFTLNITKINPSPTVQLGGTGLSSTAAVTVNPTALNFPNQPLGTTSAAQGVTITNTGPSAVTLMSAATDAPFTSSFTKSVKLQPGQFTTVDVSFFAIQQTNYTGTLILSYDVLGQNGVSLSANGAPPASLAISTYATLPAATQTAAYMANLTAVGGTPPYSWSLASGFQLPLGLSLSASGLITGTLDSSVKTGVYSFTTTVADSASNAVQAPLSLTVGAQTGSNCNQISFDVPNTSTPLVPLTDLGTGAYLTTIGGLYPGGSNVRPADHDAFGVSLAKGIQPLDSNGNPDPNGQYVLLSLGLSTARLEWSTFIATADADPAKNSHLVVVQGAQGAAAAAQLADPNSAFWTTIINNLLPNSGVTANQVVASWIEDVDTPLTGIYPQDVAQLQTHFEQIAQNLQTKFPNIKLAYFSSRIYGGYSNGIKTLNPEPYAYDDALAVRGAIEDQLNGDPSLNFDPTKGPVLAPWMAWGPYYWANGLIPRSDTLVWTCQDIEADGTHPQTPGRNKVADMLLNFFKTDDTTTPWFLAPPPKR